MQTFLLFSQGHLVFQSKDASATCFLVLSKQGNVQFALAVQGLLGFALSLQDGDLGLLFSAPPGELLLQLLKRCGPGVCQLVATHSLQHLGSLVDLAGGFHHTFKTWGVAKGHEHAVRPVRGLRDQVVAHVLGDGGGVLFGTCLTVCELAANVSTSLPVGNDGVAKLNHQSSPGLILRGVICKRCGGEVASLFTESVRSLVQHIGNRRGDSHGSLLRTGAVVFGVHTKLQTLRLHRIAVGRATDLAVAAQPASVHRAAVVQGLDQGGDSYEGRHVGYSGSDGAGGSGQPAHTGAGDTPVCGVAGDKGAQCVSANSPHCIGSAQTCQRRTSAYEVACGTYCPSGTTRHAQEVVDSGCSQLSKRLDQCLYDHAEGLGQKLLFQRPTQVATTFLAGVHQGVNQSP